MRKNLPVNLWVLAACLALLVAGLAACGLWGVEEQAPPTELAPPSAVQPSPSPALPEKPEQPEGEFPAGPAAGFEETDCPFAIPDVLEDQVHLRCGYVTVPEDHNNPAGPSIRLAVVVYEDQSADHQPDPVLVLSGGPGEKTVENTIPLLQILTAINPDRDLILFDQRGVGMSQPALECPEWVRAQRDLLDEADPEAALKVVYDSWLACRDRLVAEGYNLAAYTTVQSAADVDAIWRALGYEEVNLFGGSYGSHLAQVVMRDYPQGIRSVIIDSVWPLEKSLVVEGSITTTNAILRLLAACEAEEACSQAYPNLDDVLYEIVDRLDEEPVAISITDPTSGEEMDALLSGRTILSNLVVFLYQTEIIPVLPQAIYDVYEGDYGQMAVLRGLSLELLDAMSRGMTLSVLCSEDLINRTPDDLLEVWAGLPPELQLDDISDEKMIQYGIFGICDAWPVEQADPAVKTPVHSDIPTLVLGGEFDPVTPPEYGGLVAENLNQSYVYQFPGIGHSVNVASPCAREITARFLADPTQAPSAACLAEMPGVVFDLPGESGTLVLEPFRDEDRGFSGLVPDGWEELAPANLRRGESALDPTYFVLEAAPMSAPEMFGLLSTQVGFAPDLAPVASDTVGSFDWDFYTFDVRANPADLAIAEVGGTTFFVLLISLPEEHEALYQGLFMPAVEAIAPLSK